MSSIDGAIELIQTTQDVNAHLARVSAANALLDRAYGKPAVKEEKEIVDLPPVVIQLSQ
ncbi:hypothetical protein N9Y68_07675 [Luminiphilus sp.]|nr:hypothetical protein [Luminiphilus sp.]